MIATEVRLEKHWGMESNIVRWLKKNVGPMAVGRDSVDLDYPWYVSHDWPFKGTFHFAREQDATLFALRWA